VRPKPKAKARAKPRAAKPSAASRKPALPKPALPVGAVTRAAPAAATPAAPAWTEHEDTQLVRMAQGGETRAFDELVRRYRDKVYRLSFKILRHEEDAAEALQDAFLSAYRGLKNFKSESTFSTWLYRIATNASLMKYRKRRDNHVSLEQSQSRNDDAEPLELADWSTQPVDELLNAETRQVMEESVAKLPEELRTVFLLRDDRELSNAEVAEALELTVAAVKSRLHRARLLLRDRLNRYFTVRMTKRDRVP
jgi:RNA polymerase sigma-70 factor (ECF subfamily)